MLMLRSPHIIAASFMTIGVISLVGGFRGHSIPCDPSMRSQAPAQASFRDAPPKRMGGLIENQPRVSTSLNVPVGTAPIQSGQDVN